VYSLRRYAPPPRPHSADFLEYEPTPVPPPAPHNHNGHHNTHRSRYVQHQMMQRPKSSIDHVPPTPSTGDYWSSDPRQYSTKGRHQAANLVPNGAVGGPRHPSIKPPSSLPLKSIISNEVQQQNGGFHPDYSSQTFPSRGVVQNGVQVSPVYCKNPPSHHFLPSP
jgi:hypothetical protein